MSPFLIILISIVVCFIAAQLYKLSAGSMSLTKINMISFVFYMDLIVLSFTGSIIVLLYRNTLFNNLIDNIIGGYEAKLMVWELIIYAIFAIGIGMVISNLLFNFKRPEIESYHQKPLKPLFSADDSFLKIPLYFLSIICILSIIYTYLVIGTIPLIKSFFLKSQEEILALRAAVDRDFPGVVYVKNLFGILLTPILCYIFYCYYLLDKSVKNKFWFYLMLFFTFMILTYDASKSPFIKFLIGFVFLQVILKGKIPFKKFFWYILGLIVLLAGVFMLIAKQDLNEVFFSYNSGLTGRLFISQVSSLYQHFQLFPSEHNFIGFHSLSQVLPIGEFSDRSARIVLEITTPGFAEIGGVFNTLFLGEAYANFGWWGVFISPVWIGFLIQSLHILFLRLPKTPMFLGLFVFFSYTSNITGGFNEYIYNMQYFLLLITMVGVWIMATVLHKIHAKNTVNNAAAG